MLGPFFEWKVPFFLLSFFFKKKIIFTGRGKKKKKKNTEGRREVKCDKWEEDKMLTDVLLLTLVLILLLDPSESGPRL